MESLNYQKAMENITWPICFKEKRKILTKLVVQMKENFFEMERENPIKDIVMVGV